MKTRYFSFCHTKLLCCTTYQFEVSKSYPWIGLKQIVIFEQFTTVIRSRPLMHALEDVFFPGKNKTLRPWQKTINGFYPQHLYPRYPHTEASQCLPTNNLFRPYQKHGENKTWKLFQLLSYPLSYGSLQEDAVTEENSTYIKHSLQKRDKETIDWRANKICYSKFTWRGLQRHWDVFNQFEGIFQLRYQLHFQSLNGWPDICPIKRVRFGTWS